MQNISKTCVHPFVELAFVLFMWTNWERTTFHIKKERVQLKKHFTFEEWIHPKRVSLRIWMNIQFMLKKEVTRLEKTKDGTKGTHAHVTIVPKIKPSV